LEYRHNGPHAALGQQDGETEWWVRWTFTCSSIDQVTACAAARDEPGEPREGDPCLLFEGHPGRHSFDLAQW